MRREWEKKNRFALAHEPTKSETTTTATRTDWQYDCQQSGKGGRAEARGTLVRCIRKSSRFQHLKPPTYGEIRNRRRDDVVDGGRAPVRVRREAHLCRRRRRRRSTQLNFLRVMVYTHHIGKRVHAHAYLATGENGIHIIWVHRENRRAIKNTELSKHR